MTRIVGAAVLALMLLTGCVVDPAETKAGAVVEVAKRSVTVQLDDTGERVVYRTSKANARRCRRAPEPRRWPECTQLTRKMAANG